MSVDNKVGKWTYFSDKSSYQLQLMLSHWNSQPDRNPTLRIERGDGLLSQVWQDFNNHGQRVDCICFDGRHGGLLQITAATAGGWVELCRIGKRITIEYPWMWHCNDRVNDYLGCVGGGGVPAGALSFRSGICRLHRVHTVFCDINM